MAVAARLGLRVEPLNLPAHLMLRPAGVVGAAADDTAGDGDDEDEDEEDRVAAPADDDEEEAETLLIDAYNGGELLWLADAQERLSAIAGARVVLDPRWASPRTPAMAGGAFLLRWLNNLRAARAMRGDAEGALRALRFMRATLEAMAAQAKARRGNGGGKGSGAGGGGGGADDDPMAAALAGVGRDEGMCLYALGRWPEAAEALRSYLEAAPGAPDAAAVRAALERVRAAQRAAAAEGQRGRGEERGDSGGEA